MKYIIVLIFSMNILYSYSQILSLKEMKSDIDYYFTILNNEHPDLYRKYTKNQYDLLYKNIISEIKDSMSCVDFNRILLKMNAYTDSHTSISSNRIWGKYMNRDILPYFLIDTSSFSLLLNDDSVISINDVKVNKIVEEIYNTCSWEENALLKESNVNFYLPYYLSAFYNITEPYSILRKDMKTGAIYRDTVKVNIKKNRIGAPHVNFEFLEGDSIAVLHYNSCDLISMIYKRALTEAFEVIKKNNVKYLFIDVAKNGGGGSSSNELIFEHLNSKKSKIEILRKFNKSMIDVALKEDMEAREEYLSSKGVSWLERLVLKNELRKMKKKSPCYLKTGTMVLKEVYPKNTKGFDGLVFVIQSRATYSAAVDFVEAFRRRRMGIVVGEKPGLPIGYCGNAKEDVLPYSKIPIRYSSACATCFPLIETDENGFLVPDIPYDVYNRELGVEDYLKIIEMSHHLK